MWAAQELMVRAVRGARDADTMVAPMVRTRLRFAATLPCPCRQPRRATALDQSASHNQSRERTHFALPGLPYRRLRTPNTAEPNMAGYQWSLFSSDESMGWDLSLLR